jgi:hypothetical protein
MKIPRRTPDLPVPPDQHEPPDVEREEAGGDLPLEPDVLTAELPFDAPAPGLSADFVVDLTQLYLNDIGQHAVDARRGLTLARAMRAGGFAARRR